MHFKGEQRTPLESESWFIMHYYALLGIISAY